MPVPAATDASTLALSSLRYTSVGSLPRSCSNASIMRRSHWLPIIGVRASAVAFGRTPASTRGEPAGTSRT